MALRTLACRRKKTGAKNSAGTTPPVTPALMENAPHEFRLTV
jgi:hypothetical protein